MMYKVSFLSFWILVLTVYTVAASPQRTNGVLEKIKAGLQYASDYLEKAKDIADLVSESLGHKSTGNRTDNVKEKSRETFGTSKIVGAFFRLLGLDSQKVAAIAINSVIFLAQTISSLFELKPRPENIARNMDDNSDNIGGAWDPLNFILQNKNEKIQRLLKQAQDEELPNQLIERVDDLGHACVRLLLCKASPVIKAAQISLKNRTHVKRRQITSWLPSKDEFEENSDKCEGTHTDCSLFPES